MGSFGDEVMVQARLALSPEVSIEEAREYRLWITHLCDLLDAMSVWAAQLPRDSAGLKAEAVNVVLPELGEAAQRLRAMWPTDYARLNCATWQSFILWCREHPRYDAAGMPIDYAHAQADAKTSGKAGA